MKCKSRAVLVMASTLILGVVFVWCIYVFVCYGDCFYNNTYGLKTKLEALDGVRSVTRYRTYEGDAYVSLSLTDGGIISIGRVGNDDLAKSDGLIIESISGYDINCRKENSRIYRKGVSVLNIKNNYLADLALNNISDVIDNYDRLKEVLTRENLVFLSSPSGGKETPVAKWTCTANQL